ncbi:DEAD/DEAH box helicase [Tieghemostelium lacteum]|uniref:DEAD/DEAH box helicase n=1 Tax=Tieghemostelium lacteum TaxID=361077 RepID=A0A151ZS32_TIELA|nr:DEAD/DEAH box helicase [Tieghemostelium lacteum]|eukprot:KYQ96787.1 DEAD/DEAH box helicase [Tieghemostelium lacteum]
MLFLNLILIGIENFKHKDKHYHEPTLTSYLRSLSSTPPILFDEQVLKRSKELTKKRQEKKSKPTSTSQNSRILENFQLSWNYFSNPKLTSEADKKNRAIYNKFKEMVLEMIGNTDISSDDISSAVYETFMIVGNPQKDKNSKCESLRQIFLNSFKIANFQKLYDQVQLLLKIRSPFVTDESSSKESLERIDKFESTEWGLHLDIIDDLFSGLVQNKSKNTTTPTQTENKDQVLVQLEGNEVLVTQGKKKNKGSKQVVIVQQHQPTSSSNTQSQQQPQQHQQQQQEKIKFNQDWLIEKCYYLSKEMNLPADTILNSIKNSLKNKSNEVIQEDLINLLGFDYIEFISELVTNKSQLIQSMNSAKKDEGKGNTGGGGKKKNKGVQTSGPMSSFSIQSKDEKEIDKLTKKEEKKSNKKQGQQQQQEEDQITIKFNNDIYSNIVPATINNQTEFKGQDLVIDVPVIGRIALPPGTTRVENKDHTEVVVPPAKPRLAEPGSEPTLVEISKYISERSRMAFGEKIKFLNRIQSRVFECAYMTNENILISAPTGAGKTNIAMLTVLHQIEVSTNEFGYLDKDNFKIVYIAPLKALAAEMVDKFGKALKYLGIVVKELTGDMQLTQKELQETQIIVTTPEKWDVITRKSSDVALTKLVRLLIIDEIHLLHEDRGPVLESIVARTLRQVETSQEMIRIVGLSATLPNYKDVAAFIRANPASTFYFDSSYRPVPLKQTFIGIKDPSNSRIKERMIMNQICFDKVIASVREGNQVMVFVHSRKETVKTAEALLELAKEKKTRFISQEVAYTEKKEVELHAKSKEIKDLFRDGVSIHHAGLLRHDRNLVEKYFSSGTIKVLICTATLAWGVNLPAHTVVIKGTQIYDAKNGGFTDVGVSDVTQIFGRAGRPQFDDSGEAYLITNRDKLDEYLMLMSACLPIESKFINALEDHLNAEIVLGTVSNVREASIWIGYTYLFVRMTQNPLGYGIARNELARDRQLVEFRRNLIIKAAKRLEECKMIRFDEVSENFALTELGRIASHYYIKHGSIETFNEMLNDQLHQEQILNILSHSSEFDNIQLREEESGELDRLSETACLHATDAITSQSKVKIMLQSYLSRKAIESFSLVSDSNYIVQNSSRILRGLFEITLKRGWCGVSKQILDLCKMIDHQQWSHETPLRQLRGLSMESLKKIEERDFSPEDIREMSIDELASVLGNTTIAKTAKKTAHYFPKLYIDIDIQPITSTILKINLHIEPDFQWNDKIHGDAQPFWIWIEDSENQFIYHSEYFMLNKRVYSAAMAGTEPILLSQIIPLPNPLPNQLYVHYVSDRWISSDERIPVSFRDLVIPQQNRVVNTELLDLQPISVQALKNPEFEKLFKFSHFNPIQTQVFHTLYYTNHNVLLGSPTGSGKTICAELAMFKVFRDEPQMKVVYIAPLKALVRERMNDWKVKFQEKLGKRLVELTGDYTPNMIALQNADIVTTTPEKWDGISRNWKNRSYVTSVSLLIIDEIHLIGELRGPILEVIVSRMRLIAKETGTNIRIIGLSTAMANAVDLAEWMGIERVGLYNFRPSCRPVPIEVHIQGFQGKHYCPRMQTMNKPSFAAIQTYSPKKPVLIFVSSRRQTRLTALDLISYLVVENDPSQWLHDNIEVQLDKIRDGHLKHTLQFGIGMHHAGLNDADRQIVETLFAENKIQILISTSTLAWGVNLPAHLVIIKGTEYFDGRTKKYVDFPLTDVLQMMGRAGRPQFDKEGKAVVMVHEPKKNFYKKFLYDPFPVESHLKDFLHDHLNAEICSGTIHDKQSAIDYLINTFFFRRLLASPSYYGLKDNSVDTINTYLSDLLDSTLDDLEASRLIQVTEDDDIVSLSLGKISSFYYLNYKTVQQFNQNIKSDSDIKSLLKVLCDAAEYNEYPVRHNEEILNEELNEKLPIKMYAGFEDPHIKVHLLLQAHFERIALPITDYITDTKSALDQGVRILQAMIDVACEYGFFGTAIQIIKLLQMLVQGRWGHQSPFTTLPKIDDQIAQFITDQLKVNNITELLQKVDINSQFKTCIQNVLSESQVKEVLNIVNHLPKISIKPILPEKIQAGKALTIKIRIQRDSKKFSNGFGYAPLYSKDKNEGWILALTDQDEKLIGLKKIPQMATNSIISNFTIESAPQTPTAVYHVKLYSDTYIGLDYFDTFKVSIQQK